MLCLGLHSLLYCLRHFCSIFSFLSYKGKAKWIFSPSFVFYTTFNLSGLNVNTLNMSVQMMGAVWRVVPPVKSFICKNRKDGVCSLSTCCCCDIRRCFSFKNFSHNAHNAADDKRERAALKRLCVHASILKSLHCFDGSDQNLEEWRFISLPSRGVCFVWK